MQLGFSASTGGSARGLHEIRDVMIKPPGNFQTFKLAPQQPYGKKYANNNGYIQQYRLTERHNRHRHAPGSIHIHSSTSPISDMEIFAAAGRTIPRLANLNLNTTDLRLPIPPDIYTIKAHINGLPYTDKALVK
ncbi:MAG: hypothetical protein LBH04_00970 [Tannerellaceae bacterium]|jgi:hypothetical protein|nr:hypothetical protein [Tannerellaceae bacterium]